ncbi:MAG TPA: PEGA domain-containing protein [Candidatus Sulfotelmatobacter sp.]|nr:PEGA domain-containing protein [Candidatus Sulfotelmatobacter sp.]
MSTKIGQFEILSELAKSATSTVYKVNDESGQTVVLKAIPLSAFGDGAAALQEALLKEVESVKVLTSSNITRVTSGQEIDGQFCAAMEYVQGNSIATMLARKEGFSIWDLLDIGRQLCSGLDHAKEHGIVHYSLEPAKIMCGWDGTVKILSFGVSSVGNFVQHTSGVSPVLHYMSPEQVRGEATDTRSNLFSLGAVFYEMVTERKAFDQQDADSLRQSVLESVPTAPIRLNAKIHPLLSDLIMKALSKDPAQRYQTGRQLLDDLENCKESRPAKKAEAPKNPAATPQINPAAAQSKFVGAAAPPKPAPAPIPVAAARPAAKPPAHNPVGVPVSIAASAKPSRLATPKSAAAAAGVGGTAAPTHSAPAPSAEMTNAPEAAMEASDNASASLSWAVADEPQVDTFEPQVAPGTPKIAIDPMMAEGAPTATPSTSFSEISELPPLKEVYIAPPSAPPADVPLATPLSPAAPAFRAARKPPEKPKVQPREVAQKAIKEIKGVPPKLFGYSLAAAGILILVIGIGVTVYIHNQSDDDAATPRNVAPAVTRPAPAQPQPAQPAPQPEATAPADTQPAETQPAEAPESEAPVAQPLARSRGRNAKKKPSAPAVIPGQLTVDSTPQGALVQLDGQGDATWVTPLALSNLQPGPHTITVSKAGYSTDTRTLNVASGSKATTTIHLTQMLATLVVKSTPEGANIYVDGKDVGTKTPAQVSVNKGQHVVLVRLSGYLDETMSAQFVLGQTFNFSPTLRPLGNADSIRTVGKMSKLFGGKGNQGQGVVSIHTTPKGAQISVNQHMLDKNSPMDVALDPGNYVIDITLSGYAPVHKVVTVDKGSKFVLDEVLQAQ